MYSNAITIIVAEYAALRREIDTLRQDIYSNQKSLIIIIIAIVGGSYYLLTTSINIKNFRFKFDIMNQSIIFSYNSNNDAFGSFLTPTFLIISSIIILFSGIVLSYFHRKILDQERRIYEVATYLNKEVRKNALLVLENQIKNAGNQPENIKFDDILFGWEKFMKEIRKKIILSYPTKHSILPA